VSGRGEVEEICHQGDELYSLTGQQQQQNEATSLQPFTIRQQCTFALQFLELREFISGPSGSCINSSSCHFSRGERVPSWLYHLTKSIETPHHRAQTGIILVTSPPQSFGRSHLPLQLVLRSRNDRRCLTHRCPTITSNNFLR
jgi:hypothetical protein